MVFGSAQVPKMATLSPGVVPVVCHDVDLFSLDSLHDGGTVFWICPSYDGHVPNLVLDVDSVPDGEL